MLTQRRRQDCNDFTSNIFFASWHNCFTSIPLTGTMRDGNKSDFCAPYLKSLNDSNCKKVVGHELAEQPASVNSGLLLSRTTCNSSCLDITVRNDVNISYQKIPVPPVRTNPAWLFFFNSTTECFKTIKGTVWYFSPNCSQTAIFKYSLNQIKKGWKMPSADCSLLRLGTSYQKYVSSFTPVLPGYRLILTPWANPILNWDALHIMKVDHPGVMLEDGVCSPSPSSPNLLLDESLSNVTLYPAPGEVFSLTVIATDELLDAVSAPLVVKLGGVSSPDVKLRQNGKQVYYALYTSAHQLNGLSLDGHPGETGHFEVFVTERLNIREAGDRALLLRLYFRLRPCYPGFELHTSTTPPNAAAGDLQHVRTSEVMCRCRIETDGIKDCLQGRQIRVDKHYWAGETQPNAEEPDQNNGFPPMSLSHFVLHGNKLAYPKKTAFAVHLCGNGWCSQSSDWIYKLESPCDSKFGHIGPLCGTCPSGYRWSLGLPKCQKCTSTISLALYFLILFVGVLLLFIILLVFNIGNTPTLDSWLFFINSLYGIFRTSPSPRQAFIGVITFGIGFKCKEPQLTTPQDILSQFFQPAVLLLLIAAVWLMAKNAKAANFLRHFQRRNSLIHVLWLIMLQAYTATTFVVIGLLACVKLGDEWVHSLNGSVKCYQGEHLPYTIFAALVLMLIVMPLPFIVLWPRLHTWNRVRAILDEATHIYHDDCRWWLSMNLLRRVVLAAVTMLAHGYPTKAGVIVFLLVYIILHDMFRPYRKTNLWRLADIDNHFEVVLLVNLTLVALLQLLVFSVDEDKKRSRLEILSIPPIVISTALSLILAMSRFCYSWWQTVGHEKVFLYSSRRKRSNGEGPGGTTLAMRGLFWSNQKERSTDMHTSKLQSWSNSNENSTALRDPLLLDQLN